VARGLHLPRPPRDGAARPRRPTMCSTAKARTTTWRVIAASASSLRKVQVRRGRGAGLCHPSRAATGPRHFGLLPRQTRTRRRGVPPARTAALPRARGQRPRLRAVRARQQPGLPGDLESGRQSRRRPARMPSCAGCTRKLRCDPQRPLQIKDSSAR
jgi:hypothetical protein